jgi:hypothetical protein
MTVRFALHIGMLAGVLRVASACAHDNRIPAAKLALRSSGTAR